MKSSVSTCSTCWCVATLTLLVCLLPAISGAQGVAEVFSHGVASGDPRTDSVVLWTRVVDTTSTPEAKALRVEVALDEGFTDLVTTRQLEPPDADTDFCVKMRVDGLEAYTTYYYRFVYSIGSVFQVESAVGRTRTAPAPGDSRPLRFAVIYCNDYVGRYFNTLTKLLHDHDQDLDFVVHLGDYVYETTGDPIFQDPSAERGMMFEDVEGAIPLGDPDDPYYAASSLSNYRTLYRTYRSDPMLQELHRRWPVLVIWDDHEFSDDSWGATATYFDGRVDEQDPDRKRRAEQAFFEWVPTEIGVGADGLLAIDASILYPNSSVYRDFQFGSLLHLALTDYRSFRPDHLIPENAFPGGIVLDEATLEAALGEAVWGALRGSFDPYVNIGALGLSILEQTATLILAEAIAMEDPSVNARTARARAADMLDGNVSATYVNLLFQAAGLEAPFGPAALATFPRGLSYLYLGKQSVYSSAGSRYMVLKDTYDLLAGLLYQASAGAAQDALGPQQSAWLYGVLTQSPATWKILGSSVSMAPMVLDFTNPLIEALLPPEFPDELRSRLTLNADQWDGFPHKRAELLGLAALAPSTVVISGDIHSAFVVDHTAGVFEFTGPAVSSATFGEMVLGFVMSNPVLGGVPGIENLVALLGQLMQVSAEDDELVSPSDLFFVDTQSHGYSVVDVGEEALHVTYQMIPSQAAFTSYYAADPATLDALFYSATFTVQDGELVREVR